MGHRVRFACEPSSVAQARVFAGDAYESEGLDPDTADLGRLVISELVTNAIVHSATAVEVEVWVGPRATGGEVIDFGTARPALLEAPLMALGGRGLGIVAATTSAWGVRVHEGGKTVWFELPRAAGQPDTDPIEVTVDDLPGELRARVLAATAHARHRRISRRPLLAVPDEYEVHALAGDRLVHMVLSLRADGSVAEGTETFLSPQILEVATLPTGRVAVEVGSGDGRRWLPLPNQFVDPIRELRRQRAAPG
ncbi:MAG TPA: ATP-binding protein [Acidimicrobiia bacterium]|nr:ATP-binding protein [Acidimicrobiia bacterium]